MGKLLYLSEEMWNTFLNDIDTLKVRKMTHAQIRLMFKVILSGAFRISEVLNLTPEDIMADGKLRLKHTKGGWTVCECSKWEYRPLKLISADADCRKCHGSGKYMTDQYGWIHDDVLQELKAHALTKKIGERLFPLGRHQVLNYANEIMGARTHTFRHTKINWLAQIENYAFTNIVQKARHKNPMTTYKNYIEKNPDLVRKKEYEAMKI